MVLVQGGWCGEVMAAPRTIYRYEESALLIRGAAFMGRVCHVVLRLHKKDAARVTMPIWSTEDVETW
jgi:hypothetical protein